MILEQDTKNELSVSFLVFSQKNQKLQYKKV